MRAIAQISDLHFGRHDPRIAEALIASVNAQNPDLVVFSGDFTQRAKRGEFAEARAFALRIAAPKLVVPGNHDVPLYDIIGRIWRPLDNYRAAIAPLGVAGNAFLDDEIAVLGINTARRFPLKGGRVSFAQIEEIRRFFAALPPQMFKILVTHHPLGYPTGERIFDLAGRARHVLDVLAQRDVHLLLSGHGHRAIHGETAFQTVANRAILIAHAGTAISTRRRDGHGNTYNVVRVDGGALSLEIMEWSQSDGFRACSKFLYCLEDGRWSRTSA